MKALTYIEVGRFSVTEKAKPEVVDARNAVVRVTLGSIYTSDLHIKHDSLPRADRAMHFIEAYELFENRCDNVIKVAITSDNTLTTIDKTI